jgi:TupA-like ATPgrasp
VGGGWRRVTTVNDYRRERAAVPVNRMAVSGVICPVNVQSRIVRLIYKLPSAGVKRHALFACSNRRLLRLRNPATFNDKVNWRILNDRRPVLDWRCDKLAMKERARAITGLRVPRTYWTGTNLRELEGTALPPDWVLKPNHRSGLVHFGRGTPDIPHLQELTAGWLRSAQAADVSEWAYSRARMLLLAEEAVGEPGTPPPDYEFFVFGGEVAVIQVDTDRHTAHKRRLYLPDWSPLDVRSGHNPLAPVQPPPAGLGRMLAIAAGLGAGFDFIRVDLYDVDGEIFFGEVAPYPGSGLDRFRPASFDAELGARWKLPALAQPSTM